MKLKKMPGKLVSFGMAVVFTMSVLLTSCSQDGVGTPETEDTYDRKDESSEGKAVKDSGDTKASSGGKGNALAEELKKKYSGAGAGDYSGDVIEVRRDESVTLTLGFHLWEKDLDIDECFAIYQDADLKYPVEAGDYDYDDSTGTLTIEPPYYGIAEMDSREMDLSYLGGNYMMEDEGHGWGNLAQYYLKTTVDLETGEPLANPVITVIRVKSEISTAPQLVFDQTEDGYARFSWQAVPGAAGYLLFMINKDEETGFWEYVDVFADVAGTEWVSDVEDHESEYTEGLILSLNSRFVQFYLSDDTQAWIEEEGLKFFKGEDVAYDEYYSEYFGVMAYGAAGCSAISNLISAKDLAAMLPNEQAGYANDEVFFHLYETSDLPAMMSVTMCDGSTAQKVLEYDLDSLKRDEENNRYWITAKGFQTPFEEEFLVYDNINWETLDEDLAAIVERSEELKNKGGNVTPSLKVQEGTDTKEESSATQGTETEEIEQSQTEPEQDASTSGMLEIEITANSALSEYIALHMLETKEAIDLSDFPEAADTELIVDAFFEAQYQNPLILGVRGGSIDTDNRVLYVEYDFNRQITKDKQQRIMERVEEIAGEIITDGMSDVEKEMAINTWLCDNATYDHSALENAELYAFTQVDEEFYDSFTAYGILVDGVGVCASYSAAFKLLADAAGLNSIVVTGYLDGSVPHAWNKVNLEGNWYIVDATNNDNDMISNALLNLSDHAAYGTLVENDSFVMNANQYDYMAMEEEMEYYHIKDHYFDRDVVAQELAELLIEGGLAVLRTDYDIDDEIFYEIAQEAANEAQKSISGFYWMGVIHLQEK